MQKFILSFILILATTLVYSQTTINSNITTNTTWTLAGSPYHVTNVISIPAGVTLNIEPGVVVELDSIEITVFGTLNAVGTATDSIKFISANAPLSGGMTNTFRWLGINLQNGSSVHMEYVYGAQAASFLNFGISTNPNAVIKHCSFIENFRAIRDLNTGPVQISLDSCLFKYCRFPVIGSKMNISNSTFDFFDNGVDASDSKVLGCTFIDNINFGVVLDQGEVQNCLFYYTPAATALNFGIRLNLGFTPNGPTLIQNNQIYSFHGIWLNGNPDNMVTIKNNEICTDSINVWKWSTQPLDLTNNCWCTLDTTYIDGHNWNQNGFPSVDPFIPMDSSCVPSQVYPGDANHDQIANNFDLLPLGLHFGKTGPARVNPTINWVAQEATGWGDSLISTGVDIKHADCNGDGVIDMDDSLAINVNYFQTHNANKGSQRSIDGIPLYLGMPTSPINPGDTVKIPVMFGTVDTPAVNVYGIAFSIEYDSAIVEQGLSGVVYDSSWLGTKNVDMLTFHRDLDSLSQIDMALTRNDKMNATGVGKIADIIVVIDDDIYKTQLPFILSFKDIYVIDVDEVPLDIDDKQGIAVVEEVDTTNTDGINPELNRNLSVYPNPTDGELVIEFKNHLITGIMIRDLRGKAIAEKDILPTTRTGISLAQLPIGMYFIEVRTKDGMAIRKVLRY